MQAQNQTKKIIKRMFTYIYVDVVKDVGAVMLIQPAQIAFTRSLTPASARLAINDPFGWAL